MKCFKPILLVMMLGFVMNVSALDVSVSGFVRQEVAASITSDENPLNQTTNPYNNRTVTLDSSALGGGVTQITRQNPGSSDNRDFNYFATRVEIDAEVLVNDNWSGYMKFRALGNWDGLYGDLSGSDYFGSSTFGNDRGTMFEVNGRSSVLDIPALYADYSKGPLWLRFGNQQIAWGESLFFRVLDVPNGLDLRRHLILDYAAEEYADERIASPAIRGSYTLKSGWEIEAFAQMSNPSILPNLNTPYNVVASPFVIDHGDTRGRWNFGGRARGSLGPVDVQLIAVSRVNPDGVYRWSTSKTSTGTPISGTPFEIDPSLGVQSGAEWFGTAGMVRLNGHTALNAAIGDFQPATGAIGAVEVPTFALAKAELDLFYQLLGGLRGHLERVYKREEIFGLGLNYTVRGEPETLLDQLILRAEFTYTPDKVFTSPSLGRDFLTEDEYVLQLGMEKYHRWTESFPATYMLLQWMHKSESDMFGRHLSGMGGSETSLPDGDADANYVTIAFQQPSPTLTWRYDLAFLIDMEGGVLFQPGVRFKPNREFTIEAFANILDSDGGNDDVIGTLDHADEISFRVSYQF